MRTLSETAFAVVLIGSLCVSDGVGHTNDVFTLLVEAERRIATYTGDTGFTPGPCHEALDLIDRATAGWCPTGYVAVAASRLRASCYERLGNCAQKHLELKKYAEALCGGAKREAGMILKAEAEKELSMGEITEAVLLYRLLEKEYPEALDAQGGRLRIAEMLESDDDLRSAAAEYDRLSREYGRCDLGEDCRLAAVRLMLRARRFEEAADRLQSFRVEYPESRRSEFVLWQIGAVLNACGREKEAREAFAAYATAYPDGQYADEARQMIRREVPK